MVVPTVVPIVVATIETPVVAPIVVVAWAVPERTIEIVVRPVVIVDVDVGIAVVPIRPVIVPVGAIVVVAPITTTKITPVAVVPASVVVPIGPVPSAWSVDVVIVVVDDVVAAAVTPSNPRWAVGDAWQIIVVTDAIVDATTVSTRTVPTDGRPVRFGGWPTASTREVWAVQSATLTRAIPGNVRPVPQSRSWSRFRGANTTADVARKRVGAIHTTERRSVATGKRSRLSARLVSAKLVSTQLISTQRRPIGGRQRTWHLDVGPIARRKVSQVTWGWSS